MSAVQLSHAFGCDLFLCICFRLGRWTMWTIHPRGLQWCEASEAEDAAFGFRNPDALVLGRSVQQHLELLCCLLPRGYGKKNMGTPTWITWTIPGLSAIISRTWLVAFFTSTNSCSWHPCIIPNLWLYTYVCVYIYIYIIYIIWCVYSHGFSLKTHIEIYIIYTPTHFWIPHSCHPGICSKSIWLRHIHVFFFSLGWRCGNHVCLLFLGTTHSPA